MIINDQSVVAKEIVAKRKVNPLERHTLVCVCVTSIHDPWFLEPAQALLLLLFTTFSMSTNLSRTTSATSAAYSEQRLARAKSILERNLNKSRGAEVDLHNLVNRQCVIHLLDRSALVHRRFSFPRCFNIPRNEWTVSRILRESKIPSIRKNHL